MEAPLRIAVLEADFPRARTAARYGSYGGVFDALLKAAAKDIGMPADEVPTVTNWDIKQGFYPHLDDIDAILITGSRSNAFDSTPWILELTEFVRGVLEDQTRVRVIGVCFGHQIVGRALGARVGRNRRGWEVSVTSVHLSGRGKELFGGKDVMSIHQMHRDMVLELPIGIENLGSTVICKIQGMYARKRLITVQGHPEFTSEIVREVFEKSRMFAHEMFREMVSKMDNNHDGVIVAGAFLRFLKE